MGLGGALDMPANLDVDPTVPLGDTAATLVRLRRLRMWYGRVEQLMKARMQSLQGASAEKEFQCKKIVALCTGVPIDKVEEVRAPGAVFAPVLVLTGPRPAFGESRRGNGERGPGDRHQPSVRIHAEGP